MNKSVNYESGTYRKNQQFVAGKTTPVPAIDAFFFRISGTNIYYTETETEMIVLGAIAVTNVEAAKNGENDSCFEVVD